MRWTIKGILIELGVTILSGQWGTFKSTIVLLFALSVMTGLPFAGRFRVKRRGGVVYFAAEGNDGIDYRLQALAHEAGIDGPLPFARRRDCPKLKDPKSIPIVNALIDEATAEMQRRFNVGPVMVVFDTWAKTSGAEGRGEDDDAPTSTAVIKTLDAIGDHTKCVCLAIDHMGKDIERGTRGSSGKEAVVEGLLATIGDRTIRTALSNTRLVVRKVKDGRAGFEVPFTAREVIVGQDEDGDEITAILIDFDPPQDSPKTAPKTLKAPSAAEQLYAALDAVTEAEGTPLDRKSGQVMAAPAERVWERFSAEYRSGRGGSLGEKTKRDFFNRALREEAAGIGQRIVNGTLMLWRTKNATHRN